MRVSFIIIVYNGRLFLEAQLKALYSHAHQIIIVEGAVAGFTSNESPRSDDGTLEILEGYKDPDKKITLCQSEKHFSSKLEMFQMAETFIDSEIVWQIDVDEFYDPVVFGEVREAIMIEGWDCVEFRFQDYFYSSRWVIRGTSEELANVPRVFRWHDDCRWISHRPPAVCRDSQPDYPVKTLSGLDSSRRGWLMHNATMIYDEQVVPKFRYYNSLWSTVFGGKDRWLETTWFSLENYLCVGGFKNELTYLEENTYSVPLALLEVEKRWAKISRSETEIERILSNSHYPQLVQMCDRVNSLGIGASLKEISQCLKIVLIVLPSLESMQLRLFLVRIVIRNVARLLVRRLRKGLFNGSNNS